MKLHRFPRSPQDQSFLLVHGESFEIVEKHVAVLFIGLAVNFEIRHLLPAEAEIVHPALGHAAGESAADVVMQAVIVGPFGDGQRHQTFEPAFSLVIHAQAYKVASVDGKGSTSSVSLTDKPSALPWRTIRSR